MTARFIPTDIVGLDWVEQDSWAAGDPGTGETALNARNIKFEPMKSMHNAGYMKPEACRGPGAAVPGGEGGTLTFELALRGGAGSESEVGKLISNCGMTRHARAGGSGKIDDADSNTIEAATADIGTYVVGDGILVQGASTDQQFRFITRVRDDEDKSGGVSAGQTSVDIAPDFSDTPVATDSFFACDTFTPTIGEPTKYTTFYLWQGQGTTDRLKWVLEGCAGTFKIMTSNADGLPYVEFTYQVDNWTASEANTTTTADTFNPAHPLLGDVFTIGTATAAYTETFAFDPGIKMSPITATSGTHGRQGWLYHGVEPKFEVSIYHDIDVINTLWGGSTTYFTFESNKDTDEAWAVWMPAGQVVKPNYEDLGNEHLGLKPEILAVDPGANADSTNYPLFALAITGSGT